MVIAPVQILGGLPVIADVSFGRDYEGEYWAEVNYIYWRKANGKPGKEISQKVRDRAEEMDYGFCSVIEQVNDYLAYQEESEKEYVQLL